jgi:(S)-2-hydroxyglutarate dehydrogenase
VPNPQLPFLGVHLTRGIDGRVHAGPNAVLALAREGYDWSRVDARDLTGTLRFGGFWRLARRHARSGAAEMVRSLSHGRFADSARRLVPEIVDADLVRAPAGVRAQAVRADGTLVDDFLLERHGRVVHLLNAPSPAATASLEIARHVVARL